MGNVRCSLRNTPFILGRGGERKSSSAVPSAGEAFSWTRLLGCGRSVCVEIAELVTNKYLENNSDDDDVCERCSASFGGAA